MPQESGQIVTVKRVDGLERPMHPQPTPRWPIIELVNRSLRIGFQLGRAGMIRPAFRVTMQINQDRQHGLRTEGRLTSAPDRNKTASGPGYDAVAADMVDMESYAVARAAMAAGVPMIGLRGISDGAAPLGGMLDWTRYLVLIDGRLAAVLDLVEAAVADGLLD